MKLSYLTSVAAIALLSAPAFAADLDATKKKRAGSHPHLLGSGHHHR